MKSICILLTDHQSINDLILKKSYSKLKRNKLKNIYLIGDQRKFKHSFQISKKCKNIFFINVPMIKNKLQYLKKITLCGIELFYEKKINFLINMPLNKNKYLKNKYRGFTEFFSELFDKNITSNMLLYNKNFSVCPLTTHVELKKVEKEITKKKIIDSVLNIFNFFNKSKKIKIEILGLNPHAGKDFVTTTIENKIISPTIKLLKKRKIPVYGPQSADSAFTNTKNKVFVGMYHDQVLIPFKTMNKFDGINITIGKRLIRMSPDHGTAENIKNIKHVNTKSFINCIKFCETY